MNLIQFRQQLTEQLKKADLESYPVRPFICTGSPFDCEIMMVGFNPAREVELETFDTKIWDDNLGFDRESFAEHYDMASYEDDITWNRNHIFQQNLIDELQEHSVLETYLYSVITPKKSLLPEGLKTTEIFDWLVATILPKLIITQNPDVIKYFEKESAGILQRNIFNTINYKGHHCLILPISHLSKKWTSAEIAILREEISELLQLLVIS